MLSAKIKEYTAASHRQLESHPLFRNLNGNFNKEQYLKLLQKLQVYYEALEKSYSPFFKEEPSLEIEKRKRAYVLSQDIRNSSGALSSDTGLELPVIDSVYKAIGALYVIEGSTLGGKFICQSLALSGLDQTNGAAYFSGYGEDNGKMWKVFVEYMNGAASTEAQEQEVINTAEQVFSTLHNWLNKND